MLFDIRVKDEGQALKFVNDVLNALGKAKTEQIDYSDEDIAIHHKLESVQKSNGPFEISTEDYMVLEIKVGDLDFNMQEVIKNHMNMLNRL